MGKQQKRDKLYVTQNEHKYQYGGKNHLRKHTGYESTNLWRCCSLNFKDWTIPVMVVDDSIGHVYDMVNILPYIKKHKTDPITGKPLKTSDLIKLHYHQNAKGEYHCPVTYKLFNQYSQIVAIKTTGNVFLREAIKELNIKAKNMRDLLSNEPFKKSDIITLNDPENLKLLEYSNFHHVRSDSERKQAAGRAGVVKPTIRSTMTTQHILQKVEESTNKRLAADLAQAKINKKIKTDNSKLDDSCSSSSTQNLFTTGKCSGSLTSTALTPQTVNEYSAATSDAVLENKWRRLHDMHKTGLLQITTNLGKLNVEVFCDYMPRTCENFLGLCKIGYYDGTIFHRNIKGFMIQGGDPTGTGTGGQSIWNKPFKDEFHSKFSHDDRGILAMANSGPNSNKSQFYITYGKCLHLDNKHSVFGKLVGGMEVLDRMEKVAVDKDSSRPIEEIRILSIDIFANPVADLEVVMEAEAQKRKQAAQLLERTVPSAPMSSSSVDAPSSTVGMYLNKAKTKRPKSSAAPSLQRTKPKMKTSKKKFGGFGNFDSW